MLVQARAPKPSAFYDGLETSRAFARVHPPPDERRAYVSRPDLDAVASQAAHARYQRGLEDDRAARALFMHRRRTQRELLARQDAELRELEASLRTPYQRALERRAREAAAAAEAERLDTPQFADAQRLAQALAAAMVKARGVRGQNSGVRSTQLRDRQLHAAPPPGDSRLLHAPSLAHPTPNALAAARVNDRVATMRTNGAARPLGLGQLHALIAHMLEEKIQADAVDDAMRNERQSLAEFVSDELWRRYGLKELAQRHAANLLASAVGMAAQSGRVRLFAAAMGWIDGEGAWTAAKQNFCLGLIALLFEPSAVRERLSRHGEVWLSLPQLRAAVRAMFYSRALEVRASPSHRHRPLLLLLLQARRCRSCAPLFVPRAAFARAAGGRRAGSPRARSRARARDRTLYRSGCLRSSRR